MRHGKLWVWLLCAMCATARAGGLVITSADMQAEVGMRWIYEFASEDGTRKGHLVQTVLSEYPTGGGTMYRVASAIGNSRFADAYYMRGTWGWSLQNAASPNGPQINVPFPLYAGKTYTHRCGDMTIRCTVEGPETVTAPAGTFQALVLVQQHERDGESWTQKTWFAPKVGSVKFTTRADQMYTIALARIDPPPKTKANTGVAVVSNFDTGGPLVPQLFPRTRWQALPQDRTAMSTCEIDPVNAANGSPLCLRWTFVKDLHWANVGITPAGQWGKPADLSKYKAISFYARALKPQEVSLEFAVGPWANGNATNKNVPLELTTEWQRFEFDFAGTPQLQGIDWAKVYAIRFATWGKESNIVWLDEIQLHTARGL